MLGKAALLLVLTVGISYLLGCFNGALLISKYIFHDDIRTHGSGNAGLTNFYRVFGGGLTAVVILCDALKAVLSVLIGGWLLGYVMGWGVLGEYIAGLSCMLGHMYPCMFQFKGGKGVLSEVAMILMIDWRMGLAWLGVFLLTVLLTRMVSLGSLLGSVTFMIGTAVLYRDPLVIIFGIVIGGLVIWRHRSNVVRIVKGEESKFSFHKKDNKKEG